MKKLLFFSVFLASSLSFAQTEFTYTQEGLKPNYLVIEIPGKTQAQNYQNALGWVKESFKNADAVIQSTIENNKIRFEGVTLNGHCYKSLGIESCNDIKYLIDLEFKDGKYRIEPLNFQFYNEIYKQPQLTRWIEVNLANGSEFYNKKGELRSNSKYLIPNLISNLNKLNSDLKSYIESGSSNKLNADW